MTGCVCCDTECQSDIDFLPQILGDRDRPPAESQDNEHLSMDLHQHSRCTGASGATTLLVIGTVTCQNTADEGTRKTSEKVRLKKYPVDCKSETGKKVDTGHYLLAVTGPS